MQLQRPGRLIAGTAFTDRDGKFFFHNIERPEIYYIYIRLEGYDEVRQKVEVRGGAMSSASVTVMMNPGSFVRGGSLPTTRLEPEEERRRELLEAGTPEAALIEFDRAMEDARSGNTSRAVRRLETVIRIAPAFFDAHMELGFIQQRRRRYSEAVRAFEQARELDPDSAEPLIGIGGANIDRAQQLEKSFTPQEATKLYQVTVTLMEQATAIARHSSRAFYYLGSALYKLDQREYAESTLVWSLGRDEVIQDARLMLVNIYIKQRRYREAADQLIAYLEEYPDSPQRKDVEKMLSDIRKVLVQ